MNTFSKSVEQHLVPTLSNITNLRYFQALRNGFFAIMPLTIIGSLFMLITDFPLLGYQSFMSNLLGEDWAHYITPAYRATFNMMGLIFAGTMSYKLAENYKIDRLSALVFGIVAYTIVIPQPFATIQNQGTTNILLFEWLGTKGIITAIITSILSIEIMNICMKKNIIIKMPSSVPTMVSTAFSSLLPGMLIVAVALLINIIGVVFVGSLPELIYKLLQAPLQQIIGNPYAIIIVAGLNGLFWWFGIHPTVINSILYPILYANADANQALFEAGTLSSQTGHFGTVQMLDQFATIGGAGATIGLAITMVIVAHSARMKAMSKLAFIPSLFNINEPLIFGLPVIFNPLMLIPLTLAPIVAVLITLLSMRIGFMPMFTQLQAPWAMPFFFSGFLTSGWQGALTQLLAVASTVLIYYPFVKLLDKEYRKEEVIHQDLEDNES